MSLKRPRAKTSGPFRRRLATIRVLYRDLNGQLWGLPYALREGQSPRHIESHPQRNFIYLGSTHVDRQGKVVGWFGSMDAAEKRSVKDYLKKHADRIPHSPYEFDRID